MLHGAKPGVVELGDGIRIETRCGDHWCVDGLSIGGLVIAEPRPTPDEIAWLKEPDDEDPSISSSELQRAIRVAWHDESVVSVYLMEATFGSGGNHFNNEMKCRTYDRKTGRALRLRDVLDARTMRLLPRIRRFVAQDAMVGVGEELGPGGFEVTNQGFRLEGPSQVVLCAEAPFQLGGDIVELRPEQAVKNLYLMQ